MTGLEGIAISGFFIQIAFSNPSNVYIERCLTSGSLFSAFAQDYAISYPGSNQVRLGGIDLPLCEGINAIPSETEILFRIYFTGTPGDSTIITFSQAEMLLVNSPTSFSFCDANILSKCDSIEYFFKGAEISGNIESIGQDCDGSYNHGVPEADVNISDLDVSLLDPDCFYNNQTPVFSCFDETNAYGDYDCNVAYFRSYRITPTKDDNPGCGLTTVDLAEIQAHLLAVTCFTQKWQLIAADANQNDTVSAVDIVEIRRVILDIGPTMNSWTFVPSSTYNNMPPAGCDYIIPSYDPWIDVIDVSGDSKYNDFVGVKLGDVNGTCTDCSGNPFHPSDPPEILRLSRRPCGDGCWSFYLESDVSSLMVYSLEFELPDDSEGNVKVVNKLGGDLDFAVKGDRLRAIYFNMMRGGEHVIKGDPLVEIWLEPSAADGPRLFPFGSNELVTEEHGL